MLFRKRRALPEPRNYTPTAALQRRWHWSRDIRKSPTYKLLQRIESASGRIQGKAAGDPTSVLGFCRFATSSVGFWPDSILAVTTAEVDVVRCYLLTCPRTMIAICVWLVGEFSDRKHLYELKTFRHDPSPQIRRHVAKALRRLEAWSYLRDMAAADRDDARIQWFATAPTPRAIREAA